MKTIRFTIAILIIVFAGCEPIIIEPRSDFGVSSKIVETFEDVEFYNYSTHAYNCEWDFGDGFYSYDYNTIHYYSHPGIYTVRLAAYNGDFADYSYITIEVVEPTTVLDIQVLEFYEHYPVNNASIIVYLTYSDWINERNKIVEVFTNNEGIAIVEGLAPGYYYLDVWHENHNNYALAEDDIAFIKTPFLVSGKTTYFTAWVDYVPDNLKSKSSSRRSNILNSNVKRSLSETPKTR